MTGRRSRRALLRTAAAAAVGLAGCVGAADDPPDPTTPGSRSTSRNDTARSTATPGDATVESTSTAGAPLAVENVRVQSSFLYLTNPDAASVAAPEGTQFVFADVRETGSEAGEGAPAPDALALAADDRRFDATVAPGPTGSPYEVFSQGLAYDPDERRAGWIAFEVPDPLDVDEVALTDETEKRTVSEPLNAEAVESLAAPPVDLELVGVDAPASVGRGEPFEVTVTGENAGESDGVFRAVLNETHPTYAPNAVETAVSGGERGEWTSTFGQHLEGEVEEMTFELVAPGETRELSVDVVAD